MSLSPKFMSALVVKPSVVITPVTSMPVLLVDSLVAPCLCIATSPLPELITPPVPLVIILKSKSSDMGFFKSIKPPDVPPSSIEP